MKENIEKLGLVMEELHPRYVYPNKSRAIGVTAVNVIAIMQASTPSVKKRFDGFVHVVYNESLIKIKKKTKYTLPRRVK